MWSVNMYLQNTITNSTLRYICTHTNTCTYMYTYMIIFIYSLPRSRDSLYCYICTIAKMYTHTFIQKYTQWIHTVPYGSLERNSKTPHRTYSGYTEVISSWVIFFFSFLNVSTLEWIEKYRFKRENDLKELKGPMMPSHRTDVRRPKPVWGSWSDLCEISNGQESGPLWTSVFSSEYAAIGVSCRGNGTIVLNEGDISGAVGLEERLSVAILYPYVE